MNGSAGGTTGQHRLYPTNSIDDGLNSLSISTQQEALLSAAKKSGQLGNPNLLWASAEKQNLSNKALSIQQNTESPVKRYDIPVPMGGASHFISPLTSDKHMPREKKGSGIRPLSINQVQRIVSKDTDKMILESFNNGPQLSNYNLHNSGLPSNNLQQDVKKREQRNNSLNISMVGQHLMAQAPSTVQQPQTQKLFHKVNKQPTVHQYGAGSGQQMFVHAGQNTLMTTGVTAGGAAGSYTMSRKSTRGDNKHDPIPVSNSMNNPSKLQNSGQMELLPGITGGNGRDAANSMDL